MKRVLLFLILVGLLSVSLTTAFAAPTDAPVNVVFRDFGPSYPNDYTYALTPDGVTRAVYLLNFPLASPQQTATLQSVTFTNQVGTGLTLEFVNLSDPTPPTFPLSLPASGSAGYAVNTTCASGGAAGATVVVSYTDENSVAGTTTMNFTCGTVPNPNAPNLFFGSLFGPLPNDFDYVLDPDGITRWDAIENHAGPTGGDLIISNITLTGPTGPGVTITGVPVSFPVTLRSYGVGSFDSILIEHTCLPTVQGTVTATLVIESNDPDTPVYTVNFSCNKDVIPPINPPVVPQPTFRLGCGASTMVSSYGQGRMLSTETALYEPLAGSTTTLVIPAGTAWWITDVAAGYYQIWISCSANPVWVPADSIGPNYEAPWNGAPLPSAN